jgi:hypothetical protein
LIDTPRYFNTSNESGIICTVSKRYPPLLKEVTYPPAAASFSITRTGRESCGLLTAQAIAVERPVMPPPITMSEIFCGISRWDLGYGKR